AAAGRARRRPAVGAARFARRACGAALAAWAARARRSAALGRFLAAGAGPAALRARSRRRRLARGLGAWRRRWEALHRGAAPALGRWWKARVADVEGPAAAADVAAAFRRLRHVAPASRGALRTWRAAAAA
ncbi:hypothetical protein AURANDRAFT_69283, partial [Aureococcus anophagefferens]